MAFWIKSSTATKSKMIYSVAVNTWVYTTTTFTEWRERWKLVAFTGCFVSNVFLSASRLQRHDLCCWHLNMKRRESYRLKRRRHSDIEQQTQIEAEFSSPLGNANSTKKVIFRIYSVWTFRRQWPSKTTSFLSDQSKNSTRKAKPGNLCSDLVVAFQKENNSFENTTYHKKNVTHY